MLEEFRQKGCEKVFTGLESGSNRVLKIVNKQCTVEQSMRFVKKLKRLGFIGSFSFAMGFPGETREEIFQTLKFMTKVKEIHKSFTCSVINFIPIPGTVLYYEALKQGYTPIKKFEEVANLKGDENNVKRDDIDLKRYYHSLVFLDSMVNEYKPKNLARFPKMFFKNLAEYRVKNDYWKFPIESLMAYYYKKISVKLH